MADTGNADTGNADIGNADPDDHDLPDDRWDPLRASGAAPPLDGVLARGRRLRRRRHAVVAGTGMAFVAGALGLGLVLGGADRPRSDVVAAADPPAMVTGNEAAAAVLLRIDRSAILVTDAELARDTAEVVVLDDGTVIVGEFADPQPVVRPLRTGVISEDALAELTAAAAAVDTSGDFRVVALGGGVTTVELRTGDDVTAIAAMALGPASREAGARQELAALVDRAQELATEAATDPYQPTAYRVRNVDATDIGDEPIYPGEPTLPDPGGAPGPAPLPPVLEGDPLEITNPTTDLLPRQIEWPLDGSPPSPCAIVDDPADVAALAAVFHPPSGSAPRAGDRWSIDGLPYELAIAPLLPGDPGCDGG